MKITTSYDFPPIPDRSMDWSAVDEDTYDCDCDQDGFYSLGPVGHGRTEAEAITDLLQQIEDRAGARAPLRSPAAATRGAISSH